MAFDNRGTDSRSNLDSLQGLSAQQACKDLTSPYEGAAASWSRAKEALTEAQVALERAEQRHHEAKSLEGQTWDELQVVAGRAPSPLVGGEIRAPTASYAGLRR